MRLVAVGPPCPGCGSARHTRRVGARVSDNADLYGCASGSVYEKRGCGHVFTPADPEAASTVCGDPAPSQKPVRARQPSVRRPEPVPANQTALF